MSIKIRSGKLEVLETGVVILRPEEETVFELADIRFSFEFMDTADDKQLIEPKLVGEKHLQIQFVNFKNVLGTGTVDPIAIGHIGGRQLLLAVWIRLLGGESQRREMVYTFYLGERLHG